MNDQNQIHEFTRGPHNYLVKVAGIAKAAAQNSSDHDERTLTRYIGQLGQPDSPNEDYGNCDALKDSHALGAHLALAKIGLMQGNHAKLSKHLDQALEYHGAIHGALHAAAAHSGEINPMAVRERQED
jgi:hypothetical protein